MNIDRLYDSWVATYNPYKTNYIAGVDFPLFYQYVLALECDLPVETIMKVTNNLDSVEESAFVKETKVWGVSVRNLNDYLRGEPKGS